MSKEIEAQNTAPEKVQAYQDKISVMEEVIADLRVEPILSDDLVQKYASYGLQNIQKIVYLGDADFLFFDARDDHIKHLKDFGYEEERKGYLFGFGFVFSDESKYFHIDSSTSLEKSREFSARMRRGYGYIPIEWIDIERLSIREMSYDIWEKENDLGSPTDQKPSFDEKKKLSQKNINNSYVKFLKKDLDWEPWIKDFLLLKYGGSLDEIRMFIENFKNPSRKVLLYEKILQDEDIYFQKNKSEQDRKNFLSFTCKAMEENPDFFQNLSLCASLIGRALDVKNASKQYLDYENKLLQQHLELNLKLANDPKTPNLCYEEIQYEHLSPDMIGKIISDLQFREKDFTSRELFSLLRCIKIDSGIKGEVQKRGEIAEKIKKGEELSDLEEFSWNWYSKNNPDEENRLGDLSNWYPVIFEVYKRMEEINSEDALTIYLELMRQAGEIGYVDFIDARIGDFYENFGEFSYRYTPEGIFYVVKALSKYGGKYENFIIELASKIYDNYKNEAKDFPESWRTSFLEEQGNYFYQLIENISNKEKVLLFLLEYSYKDSAVSFDRMAEMIISEIEKPEEFFAEISLKQNFPIDAKYSLLSKLVKKRLLLRDLDGFQKGCEELSVLTEEISEGRKTNLLYLYSINSLIKELCTFSRQLYWDSKNSPNIKETQQLTRIILSKAEEWLPLLNRILSDKNILEEMDIRELADFLISVDNLLLTFDRPDINVKIQEVIEYQVDRYIKLFKERPDMFSNNLGGSSDSYWEAFDQLFATLGVLSIYIDGRNCMYDFDQNGNAILDDYGYPIANKEKMWQFREDKKIREIRTPEVDRVTKKYVGLLVFLSNRNALNQKNRMYSFNFKYPSDDCLKSYNYEFSSLLDGYDYRYHLNGYIFPMLREQKVKYVL